MGITFNHLYTFANAPLGRFRTGLLRTGNYGLYLKTLTEGFNPSAVEKLMCRTLLSVSWDGFLYDCDFNLAVDRPPETGKSTSRTFGNFLRPAPRSRSETTATPAQRARASLEAARYRPRRAGEN